MTSHRQILFALSFAVALCSGPVHGQGNGNSQGAEHANGNATQSDSQPPGNGGNDGNVGAASAADRGGQDNDANKQSDEDFVLDAVAGAEALPFESILERLRQVTAARVIDARLYNVSNVLVYEVKVLGTDGLLRRFYYDAKAGSQIGIK
ncbi:PepSY domain-containing protein [Devosia sp.]|uniref:PepSY domain-containing protein n=1 Tax=Devosia sp. TaxID=1871048 RepID=UPI002735F196|nr:hypothetical protein [Devosia sp.]MDP2778916.1 hypothetical protein [Devosia sp.]